MTEFFQCSPWLFSVADFTDLCAICTTNSQVLLEKEKTFFATEFCRENIYDRIFSVFSVALFRGWG